MNDSELDRLIDEALESMPKMPLPDSEQSWLEVKQQYAKLRRKQRTRKRLALSSLVAISFLAGAILFGNPTGVTAFSPFYQAVKELPNQVVAFFFGSNMTSDKGAKTAAPNDSDIVSDEDFSLVEDAEMTMVEVTEEQASEMLQFDMPKLSYIPKGYTRMQIEVAQSKRETKSNHIMFVYQNSKQKLLRITITQLGDNFAIGSGANLAEATVETVQLSLSEGILTLTKGGTNKLEFLQSNLYIHILGSIDRNDLIQIAEHIMK